MRTSFRAGWRLPMLALLLVVLGMRGWADAQPAETELNNIKLNSMFTDVLAVKGAPTSFGPAVAEADNLMALLENPPTTTLSAVPGAPGGMPGPGRPSFMPGSSMPGMSPGMPEATKKPKPQYAIWLYASTNWATYVFFNQRGLVVGVVVAAKNPQVKVPVQTQSNFHIGSKLMDVVAYYDWPDPFTTVGSDYYCTYPASTITFGLEQRSHEVVSIAIGVPYVADTAQARQGSKMPGAPGMMMGAPGAPGFPSMSPSN